MKIKATLITVAIVLATLYVTNRSEAVSQVING